MPKSSENTERELGGSNRAHTSEPRVETNPSPDVMELLNHYGITTVPKAVYEWGGYRYSNAADAIAAAKRGVSA